MAKLDDIFSNDNDEKKEDKLTINKNYAKKFQKFKECQELDRRNLILFSFVDIQ